MSARSDAAFVQLRRGAAGIARHILRWRAVAQSPAAPDREVSAIQPPAAAAYHRALFLSDLHLGALGCRAEPILRFLERNDAETIYLVGDILDVWHPLALHWTPAHDRILALLRVRAAAGTRLVYLIGNHDAAMRDPREAARLPAAYHEDAVHVTARGERLLVLHGDVCDRRWRRGPTLTRLGSRLDAGLRLTERALVSLRLRLTLRGRRAMMNAARRIDGILWDGGTGHLSDRAVRSRLFAPRPAELCLPDARGVVDAALARVTALVARGRQHERRITALAVRRGCDGVVCGHFHIAGLHRDHGVLYANCGDWIDGFTALAEGHDGLLCLLDGQSAARPAPSPWAQGSVVQTGA